MKNYYSLLGIEENASIEQINEAYRKLAQKFHPDRNNNDPYFTSLFKQINDAKQILTDPEKKSEFDLLLTNYSDAYDLFTQQRLEDEFNRQQRRKQLEKAASRKKAILIFCGILLFLFMGYVLWAEINNKPSFSFNDKVKFSSIQEVPADSISTMKGIVISQREKNASKNTQRRPIKVENNIDEKKAPEKKKSAETKNDKQFTKEELNNILQKINTERSKNNYNTNCITIKKAKNSNVDSDFRIASFLRKKGFIISGRETISGNFKGYNVEFNGICLNLTIGEM